MLDRSPRGAVTSTTYEDGNVQVTSIEAAPATMLALMPFWPTRRHACFDCLCCTEVCC
ncbi:hypothetical protein [Rhodococcus coprophilus]